MPRKSHMFAALVPLVAAVLLFRAFAIDFHSLQVVAAKLNLSWPLAVHPDATQVPITTNDGSQFAVNDGKTGGSPSNAHHDLHVPPKAHHHHHHEQTTVPPVPQFTRKIVAVGDLHGDMPNAQSVLQMAGVVDSEGKWTGNVDIFVQTGDIIDR